LGAKKDWSRARPTSPGADAPVPRLRKQTTLLVGSLSPPPLGQALELVGEVGDLLCVHAYPSRAGTFGVNGEDGLRSYLMGFIEGEQMAEENL
jgi:hypothetical protein